MALGSRYTARKGDGISRLLVAHSSLVVSIDDKVMGNLHHSF